MFMWKTSVTGHARYVEHYRCYLPVKLVLGRLQNTKCFLNKCPRTNLIVVSTYRGENEMRRALFTVGGHLPARGFEIQRSRTNLTLLHLAWRQINGDGILQSRGTTLTTYHIYHCLHASTTIASCTQVQR